MSKFEVNQEKNKFEFILYKHEEGLKVTFDLFEFDGTFSWRYHCMMTEWEGEWIELFFRNKEFTSSYWEWQKSKEIKEKTTNSLYELMSLIKQHPKWRLKVMHILDDSSREIWNRV